MRLLVKNDRFTTIGNSEVRDVKNNRDVTIGGTQTKTFTSPEPNAPRTVQTDTNGHTKLEVGTSIVEVKDGEIKLDTGGGAFILLKGDSILIKAANALDMYGVGAVNISSDAVVDVKGTPIKLNC
jgi:hypothetical protein